MKKTVLAEQTVQSKSKEYDIFGKLDKSARVIDEETGRSVAMAMKSMLGDRTSVATRISAS